MAPAADLMERITRVFADRLNLDVPSAATDLFEAGALDSMAFVELLAQIEREFGIAVSLEDLEMDNFRTIEKIADFVAARQGAKDLPLPADRPLLAGRAGG